MDLRASGLVLACVVVILVSTSRGQEARSANDVRTFGAVGDGKADDTDAIQRAVDASGSVWLSAGKYRLTRSINVPLGRAGFTSIRGGGAATLIMSGAGPAIKVTGTHDGTADPKTVKPAVWERERMPIIGGFEIIGRHAEADGVWVEGAMQLVVTQLNVRDARHAVRLHQRNRNVIVSDCHFYDNHGVGLFLDNVNLHQINIGNSHVSYNDDGGIVVAGGNVRNIQIHGCDLEGNMGADSDGSCNVLFDSREGSIAEAAIIGCTIQHTRRAKDSANIRVRGAGVRHRGGKSFGARFGNIAIANNVLSDVQHNIDLQDVRGVTINGNTMWKGFSHSIRVRGSSRVVIGANVVDRNLQYQDIDGSKDQVLIEQCQGVQIQGLQVSGVRDVGASVLIRRSQRVSIQGLTVLDSDGVQLQLENVSESRVSDCLLSDKREGRKAPGLRVLRGNGVQVVDNMIFGGWKTDGRLIVVRGNIDNSVLEPAP